MNIIKTKLEKYKIILICVHISDKGQTLVEYGLLIVLIALIALLMLKGTGLQINNVYYSRINNMLAR